MTVRKLWHIQIGATVFTASGEIFCYVTLGGIGFRGAEKRRILSGFSPGSIGTI